MDPLSQAVTGAALAGMFAKAPQIRPALIIGGLAGMAADLDVLIRSGSDPLLALEYHRHFTHALPFAPIGALICAAFFFLFPLCRRHLSFRQTYLYSLLGYATHGLLDACTSYGTHLWWPFTNVRESWDYIGIIDLFYTVPALALLIVAGAKRCHNCAVAALVWMLAYMALAVWQHGRVLDEAERWAATKSRLVNELTVRPTIGNLWLWRVIYHDGSRWQTAAIRRPFWPGGVTRIYPGESAPVFAVPNGDDAALRDMHRFTYFSDGYVSHHVIDGITVVGDIRYALLPTSATPLWGIALPEDSNRHVDFVQFPRTIDWQRTWDYLLGRDIPNWISQGQVKAEPGNGWLRDQVSDPARK